MPAQARVAPAVHLHPTQPDTHSWLLGHLQAALQPLLEQVDPALDLQEAAWQVGRPGGAGAKAEVVT